MVLNTTASKGTLAQEASTPSLRILQMDAGSIGDIGNSVNLFRGDVVLPVELVALQSRGGLEVKLALNYQSSVRDEVDTWNMETPTGIAGVGWALPFDLIIRDSMGAIVPEEQTFYMGTSDGARTRLHCVSNSGGEWVFESETHMFHRIVYRPADDVWNIVTNDGLTRVYGDTFETRQQGAKWGGAQGNWNDSSIRMGQTAFTLAWNLSRIRNRWNDEIRFEYAKDQVALGGPQGVAYTRACYLTHITDDAGRSVSLRFREKLYTDQVKEYQLPHVPGGPGAPEAYQDRYPTRYLESLSVSQEVDGSSVPLAEVRFLYDVQRYSDAPGDAAFMMKRYLVGICSVTPDRELSPVIRFDYYTGNEAADARLHRGALKQVFYPSGASARYVYDELPMAGSSRDRTLGRTEIGPGVPRIWFGPTYAVLASYDEVGAPRLIVNVFDWNGSWIDSRPLDQVLDGKIDIEKLDVTLRGDWFLLSFKQTGSATDAALIAYAFNRRLGRFGEWEAVKLEMPETDPGHPDCQICAGAEFVAAVADFGDNLYRYVWDPRRRTWTPAHHRLNDDGHYALAAERNYLAVCQYLPRINQADLTIHYLDVASRTWGEVSLATVQPLWADKLPKPSWTLSGCFATATYITRQNEEPGTVDYEVGTFLWDQEFTNVRANYRRFSDVPAKDNQPFWYSAAWGSLVGNVGHLWRYNGHEWVEGEVGSFAPGEEGSYVYSQDLAIAASDKHSQAVAYDPYLDRFVPLAFQSGDRGPRQPTISQRFVTVRENIYFRDANGELRVVGSISPDATQVVNLAPSYIAYAGHLDETYVCLLQNGEPAGIAARVSARLFTEKGGPGTMLAGSGAFATYRGKSFDEAESITLYRVLNQGFEGPIPDFAITQLVVNDGFGEERSIFYRYHGKGTTGPYGVTSQYGEVDVVPADLATTPFGYTKNIYFNGLVPAADKGDTPYSLLNGTLAEKILFDSKGRKVASERHVWEVARQIADLAHGGQPLQLIGGYPRVTCVESTAYDPERPGAALTKKLTMAYNEAVGQPRTRVSQNYTADGTLTERTEAFTFAYERYPQLVAENVLAPTVATRVTVDGETVSLDVTTWTAAWSTTSVLAPHRSYRARAATAAMRDTDWSEVTEPPADQWLWLSRTLQRDRHGNITEQVGDDGIAQSTIFDVSGRFAVATAKGASLLGQQFSYLSFESYEPLQGWTLGGSPESLRRQIDSGDGCPGTRSLRMEPQAGSYPLACMLQVAESAGGSYLFTCWVKTGAGIGSGAVWTLTVGSTAAELPIPDTAGAWQQIHRLVELPVGTSPCLVSLVLENRSGGVVRVGGITFAPVAAEVQGLVLDPAYLRETARVARQGAVTRSVYGSQGDLVGETKPGDSPVKITNRYHGRIGRGQGASVADPSSTLFIKPQGWALLQRFDTGAQWRLSWSTPEYTRWTPAGGRLLHRPGTEDMLTCIALPAAPAYGMAVRVLPRVAFTADVGLVIGDKVRLVWNPARAAWRLQDLQAGTERWAPPRVLLELAFGDYANLLNASRLPDSLPVLFTRAGLPLGPDSQVTMVSESVHWRIRDGSGLVYYLAGDSVTGKIRVAVAPSAWTLLVDRDRVALFEDGGLVLSHQSTAPIVGKPSIVVSDEVAIDNLMLFTDPQIELAYQDGLGQNRQRQVVDGGGPVAVAMMLDALGRPVITSLAARLKPGMSDWLTYNGDLANFDWRTLAMTGLVQTQHVGTGNYPYVRTRYEDSPLGRVVELGGAGPEFAIRSEGEAHTTRTRYGLSDGTLGYAANRFFTRTAVDPDGVTKVTVTDLSDQTVAIATLASVEPPVQFVQRKTYDKGGRVTAISHPSGSADRFSYDFLGQKTSEAYANEGEALFCYDRRGRLRFMRPANGAGAAPYIRYWKYDGLARPVEQGWHPCAWGGELRPDDPKWPLGQPSQEVVYAGGDQPDLFWLGKPVKAISRNQVSGPGQTDTFSSVESFFYNLSGEVVRKRLRVEQFRPVDYDVTYTYDNLGKALTITCPTADGGAGRVLGYGYDQVGRVSAGFIDQSRCISYAYGTDGKVESETMQVDGKEVARREHAWNPNGWQWRVSDPTLTETIQYTQGGARKPGGYYNGSPACIITDRPNAPQVLRRFGYDRIGRLTQVVQEDQGESGYEYDANDNLARLGAAALARKADDRLDSRTEGPATTRYQHDQSGYSVGWTAPDGAASLSLTWDWFSDRLLGSRLIQGDNRYDTVIRYGYQGRRVYRSSSNPAGTEAVLYVRGLSGEPLVELSREGSEKLFVPGPNGTPLLIVNGNLLFVTQDQLGSVRSIFDQTGALLAAFDYDPYGGLLRAPGGSQPDSFRYRFANRELDQTGLYDFLARIYDSQIGAFISPDPKHQFESPYVYVGGNPLRLIDPSGEEGVTLTTVLLMMLFGAITVGALGLVSGAIGGAIAAAQKPEEDFPGEKARTIIGFMGMGLAMGVISGGFGGAVAPLSGWGAVIAFGGLTVTGFALGAAESTVQAALAQDDVGSAWWKGGLVGVATTVVGGAASLIGGAILSKATNLLTKQVVRDISTNIQFAEYVTFTKKPPAALTRLGEFTVSVVSGAAGGVAGGVMGGILCDEDKGNAVLLGTLQGLGLGALGGFADGSTNSIGKKFVPGWENVNEGVRRAKGYL